MNFRLLELKMTAQLSEVTNWFSFNLFLSKLFDSDALQFSYYYLFFQKNIIVPKLNISKHCFAKTGIHPEDKLLCCCSTWVGIRGRLISYWMIIRRNPKGNLQTCAATVCERVGKSLVTQAVLKPASDRPKAARSPAPPAPTTTASNSWSTTGYWVEIWEEKYQKHNDHTRPLAYDI